MSDAASTILRRCPVTRLSIGGVDWGTLIEREMIVERRPGSEVRRAAESEGLTSLRESALRKVFAGVSTLHEINRVTFVEEVSAKH